MTDHGSYRADLRAFLEASYQMAGYPGSPTCCGR